MKQILKHTILLLCILASTAQVVHLSAHIFNSHQESDQESIHLVDDHKCTICTHSVIPSSPTNSTYVEITWVNDTYNSTINVYTNQFYKTIDLKSSYLRGPPYLI